LDANRKQVVELLITKCRWLFHH